MLANVPSTISGWSNILKYKSIKYVEVYEEFNDISLITEKPMSMPMIAVSEALSTKSESSLMQIMRQFKESARRHWIQSNYFIDLEVAIKYQESCSICSHEDSKFIDSIFFISPSLKNNHKNIFAK